MEICTLKLRLCPDAAQKEILEKTFYYCRVLWNRMISDEEKLSREMGRHFIPAPARYKREMPGLKEVDSLALGALHHKLKKAFQDHLYNPHDHGKPEQVSEIVRYTTFCQTSKYGHTIRFTQGGLKLPKLGAVKTELHRELPGGSLIKSAVVQKEGQEYFCTLSYEAAADTLAAELPAAEAQERLPA